tara:strand:- start:660 stop:1040 length:381 start_codon:yes stop_codon:yes gene_type:complete
MFKKIYIFFGLFMFLVGFPMTFFYPQIGSVLFLGVLIPTLVSYINLEVIDWLNKHYDIFITFGFNMVQFIVKTIFMLLMVYIGVKIMNFDFRIYVPVLCLTWFFFHILEALYTQNIINKKSASKES